jgi:hypothetical protein
VESLIRRPPYAPAGAYLSARTPVPSVRESTSLSAVP